MGFRRSFNLWELHSLSLFGRYITYCSFFNGHPWNKIRPPAGGVVPSYKTQRSVKFFQLTSLKSEILLFRTGAFGIFSGTEENESQDQTCKGKVQGSESAIRGSRPRKDTRKKKKRTDSEFPRRPHKIFATLASFQRKCNLCPRAPLSAEIRKRSQIQR